MNTQKTSTLGMRIALVFIFITAILLPSGAAFSPALAQTPSGTGETDALPANSTAGPEQQEPDNPYFSIKTATLADGTELEAYVINGPSTPPAGYEQERKPVEESRLNAMASLTLTVPVFNWFYGCSATSGAMIAGYYDRNGYPNMYTGPTNGGVMPLNNTSWGNWTDGAGDSYGQCPLTASRNGLDGRTTRGSIDDYWVAYDSNTQDPFITGSWTEHTYGAAIGDYMRTSQSNYGNSDGGTQFWNYNSTLPGPLTCDDMVDGGITNDGTVGRRAFYQAKGYTVTDCYNQKTDNNNGGFTYAMYKAEIDAGRPVMLNLAGHTIVGVGYNDDSGNLVYIHDTWDHSVHSFTWGGSYGGMTLLSVSIVNLASAACNTPTTPSLSTPSNGSTVTNSTPSFDWSDSTYANLYDFVLDDNSDFSSPIVNNTSVGASAYTLTSSLSNGTYYWKVRGHNTSGGCDVYGSWSSTWSLVVNAGTPPSAFNKISPSNGATGVSTGPILTWGASTGAEEYQYCYYPVESGSCTNWMSNGTALSTTLNGLLHSHTYYWQVRAVNSAGTVYANTNTQWTFSTVSGVDTYFAYLPVVYYTKAYTGKVTYNKAAMAGVEMNMAYSTDYGASWDDYYATTTTNSKGEFSFEAPAVGDGKRFAVYYNNPTDNPKYLWYFECSLVDDTSDGYVCNFDLLDITLSSPADNAHVGTPVTFSWKKRPFTTDNYYWMLYNTDFEDTISDDLGYVGSVKYGFCGLAWRYQNLWWINVETPDGNGVGFDTHSLYINSPSSCSTSGTLQDTDLKATFEGLQDSSTAQRLPLLTWLLANGKITPPTPR